MVSAKRSAETPIDGLELRRDEHTAHWESVADTLCHGNQVGTDAKPLMGEEASATTITALYLIADEHGAIFLAGGSQSLRKFSIDDIAAADTLYTL